MIDADLMLDNAVVPNGVQVEAACPGDGNVVAAAFASLRRIVNIKPSPSGKDAERLDCDWGVPRKAAPGPRTAVRA
jgi:hypothetical protein